ncbi:MAG: TolC family protein, partial [Armatimonadota bacterium]
VVSLYIEVIAASFRLVTAEQSEKAAAQLNAAVRELVDAGKLPGTQATRTSIELSRATATRRQRLADQSAILRRFSSALGANRPLVTGSLPLLEARRPSDQELIAQRADLLLLQAEYREAEAEARVVRASRSPQLELQGRRSAWQESDSTFGARIQLTVPFNDSGRSRAEEAAARTKSKAAQKSLEDGLKMARSEVEASQIEVTGALERVESLTSILKVSQDLFVRSQLGLREGASTLIDILDAARAVREVEESLIEAKTDLALAWARHLKATGLLLEVKQ